MRRAGRRHRLLSAARRFLSAAQMQVTLSAPSAPRRSSPWPLMAGQRLRVRGQGSVTVRAPSRCRPPASANITPAPCLSGVPRSVPLQYSYRMHSLALQQSGFGSVRAQPGTRADARNSVLSSLGVPSRASQLIRWASRARSSRARVFLSCCAPVPMSKSRPSETSAGRWQRRRRIGGRSYLP